MHISNRGQVLFTVGETTVTSVATATTLLGTVYGNTTVPANTLVAGTTFEWFFWGQYTNQITIQTMNWGLSLGGVTLQSKNSIQNLGGSDVVNNKLWKMYGSLLIKTTGSSGTVSRYGGSFLWTLNSTSRVDEEFTNSGTINTTIDNSIVFNSTNGSSTTNQSNTVYGGYVSIIRP